MLPHEGRNATCRREARKPPPPPRRAYMAKERIVGSSRWKELIEVASPISGRELDPALPPLVPRPTLAAPLVRHFTLLNIR